MTAGKIRESFGERATPSQLHALGVSQLLAGRYDDAAQSLLAASREQPANARYLNDVATVQLERARLGLRPDDLPRALAAADRARRLDPSLREAWFNRALAVSSLSLTAEAKSAWTEYLKRDSVSPWATEARSRLKDIAKQTPAQAWSAMEGRLQSKVDANTADEAVRTHVTEARNLIENTLFAEWANAVLAGGGATELESVRTMAAAMLRTSGDAFASDAVAAIDRANARGAITLMQLARAHADYAAAAALYADDKHAAAEPGLRKAVAALEAAGTPFAVKARVDLATIDYVFGRYVQALATTRRELAASREHSYRFAAARSTWVIGLTAFVQGRHADARASYEDTLSEFVAMGDAEQTAAAHNLLAALFHYIGDDVQAWEHMLPALAGLDVTRSLKLRHGLLLNAALNVRRIDASAALMIQDEVVRNAHSWGREAAIAEAHAQRASLLASLNHADAAKQELAQARRQLDASLDLPLRARVEPLVLSTESELLRATNPAAAVKAAETAIALATRRGDKLRVARLQLQLAQANIVWGNRSGEAELALARGIEAFELERRSMPDEGRISSRDELWGLFETSVHLAIKKNDLNRAFAMAERGRARTLAEARRSPAPRTLKSIQAGLASDEAVVALNQFEDELAIWVIRSTGTTVVSRPVTRRAAEQLVARHQAEIWQGSSDASAGRALFSEILRPMVAQLQGANRLVVVPDHTYADTSFAALIDGRTNRFLVEDYGVRMAPSVSAYVGAALSRATTADSGATVMGSGERADIEARAVAALYPSAVLLTGRSATRSSLFSTAMKSGVVHVVAPVSSSATNPLLSRLMVSDEPGARYSGAITGSDIAQQPWSRIKLVVLDEVETRPSNRGEGTLSLARAFLAAGVPAVLGTLPGADEGASRDLMIGFHREMSRGMSAEQALHTVQRNAIQQNGRRLGAWSALVIYGSDR